VHCIITFKVGGVFLSKILVFFVMAIDRSSMDSENDGSAGLLAPARLQPGV